MFKVQKESLLLGLFLTILFLISACETGGSKDTQEELDMIEGEDRLPAREDTLMDSLEIKTLDSTEISEMRKLLDEGIKYPPYMLFEIEMNWLSAQSNMVSPSVRRWIPIWKDADPETQS